VLVWVPGGPGRELLGDPPAGVRVETAPEDPERAAGLADVEVLLVPEWPADRLDAALRAMTSLRVLQLPSAGVEWIAGRVPGGVTLCSARGVHDASVADWAAGAILMMQRRLAVFRDAQTEGRWRPQDAPDLAGTSLLIVGHGAIGRALEARMTPFGVRVQGVARRPRPGVAGMDALPELLGQADVVAIGLPLTPATEGIVDAGFLARMNPGALLVNYARGRHVVTADLLDALGEGRVRAALDVTDPEPLPDGHPLWTAPGALITPHIAGDTDGRHVRVFALMRGQLERLAAGEPPANVVAEGY